MDVDLSTDLRALLPLVAPLLSGHSDVAIGSRLAHGARVVRGPKRELISRGYNRLLHATLRARFSDAQCGFKAVRRDALDGLLADVRDDAWFFDTELLVLAQRRGLRIHEVPVDWVDDPDSRVDIVRTALEDLKGIARLALTGPVARFMAVGVLSTLAYALLFLLLRGPLGADGANIAALAITGVGNTAANRRLTFGVRGRKGLAAPARRRLPRLPAHGRSHDRRARGPARPRRRPAARGRARGAGDREHRRHGHALRRAAQLGLRPRAPRARRARRSGRAARDHRAVARSSPSRHPRSPRMSATAPALPRRAGERDRRAADRLRSVVRGRPADPVWVRPSLIAIVALAAALCLWDLTISGYANTYYAAAARAASESWKAWFFGALDPGSFITVDKPPLSLWLMGLSARALGFSSFSILLPQALCTIAAVGLLYATARRVSGPVAGLVAAAVLAVSPITVAMARVDMPDALLVLLLVASAWLLVRAIETGRTKFLLWCGAVVGLAFMTKMLQGWMVVPALATAYLLAGPPRLLVRIRQLVFAGLAMVAVSAAWPLAVSLWPAGSRPYIGGSTNGSVWDLIFGYNGFGRLTGAERRVGAGSPGSAAAAASAALPACGGCSTSRSAPRSAGCCRSPRSPSSPGCGSRAARRGPTCAARASCSSASGRSSTAPSSPASRASSTRTT